MTKRAIALLREHGEFGLFRYLVICCNFVYLNGGGKRHEAGWMGAQEQNNTIRKSATSKAYKPFFKKKKVKGC